jgi:hypothetical protein
MIYTGLSCSILVAKTKRFKHLKFVDRDVTLAQRQCTVDLKLLTIQVQDTY